MRGQVGRQDETQQYNGITQGVIWQQLLLFFFPLLFGTFFQMLYNTTDAVIVGRFVGTVALSAIGGAASQIVNVIVGAFLGLASGASVVIAQYFGARDDEKVSASVHTSIAMSVLFGAVFMVAGILLADPMLKGMNTPADSFADSRIYLQIYFAGMVPNLIYNMGAGILRAIGDSKRPLYYLIVSCLANIGLDLLFIIVFHLETFGAALATVISQGIAMVLCVIYIYAKMPMLRPDRSEWKISSSTIKQQLKYGIPMAVQYSITASGTVIMQSAFNVFDSVAVTAIAAASKFQGIITQGMFTVGQTMAAYAGQNYGARDMGRIRQGVKAALKIYVVYSIAAALLAVFLVPHVLWIFFDSEVDVSIYIPWARTYIIECAICYFFLAMIFIYRHTIQSIGYASIAMVLGFVELAARIITSFYAIYAHNYYIAVASDPLAWIAAGLCGMFIALSIFKKIEKRWNMAEPEKTSKALS